MQVLEKQDAPLNVSGKRLFGLVRELAGGFPGPVGDEPKGPWGPVMRRAIEKMRIQEGPVPDPWRSAGGGVYRNGADRASAIALNPQPLPPRFVFARAVAQSVIERAELMQDIADATSGDENGIIIVGGYLSRFADDYCGNGHIFKHPHPHRHEAADEPDAA